MKRTLLTGVLVLAAVAPGLMAQIKPKSKAERDAVVALGAAQADGPDALIKGVDALLETYADTDYKEAVLLLEATAYQQKGDYASAEVTNQRVLDANPKNPQAYMQMGEVILQHVGENDLDKEQRLALAEKNFNLGLTNIESKPNAGITDADWADNKKFMRAQLENDLGMLALKRKTYDVAAANFKLAVGDDAQPAYQVREALALQKSGKNDEALGICDKLLADPQLHPAIKKVAVSVKTLATQAKAAAAK